MAPAKTTPVLLAVDVGNSNVTLGRFEGETLAAQLAVAGADFEALAGKRGAADLLRPPPDRLVAASVAPAHLAAFRRWALGECATRVEVLGVDLPIPIENRTDRPEQVGADRLLSALAARRRVRGPAVVVDFGTAITFDVLSRDGAYLGGAICAGLRLTLESLHRRTALLPLVAPTRPARAIGRTTEEALASGMYYGFIGLVERTLREVLREFNEPDAAVLATGGDAALIAREVPAVGLVTPALVLEGIAIAAGALAP
ncbi:MAG: type III pantothenate kinase [Planctomycetes bacterium]|nr:type III pantothenate kinase [Planctomycetota bacterium]